jgi:hypothetical protein
MLSHSLDYNKMSDKLFRASKVPPNYFLYTLGFLKNVSVLKISYLKQDYIRKTGLDYLLIQVNCYN